jgi:adenosylcobinamide hydrolase
MKAETGINGISMELVASTEAAYLRFHSDQSLRTLNSSPWGGGFGFHHDLVNRQVDKSYNAADPILEMNAFLEQEGLEPALTAGMLTAAQVRHVGFHTLQWGDYTPQNGSDGPKGLGGTEPTNLLKVSAWVTVGLSNKARAGLELPATALYPGTINSIILIDGKLTDAAMVNAVITATEAKAAALQELDIRMGEQAGNKFATGTTTDAVLLATTNRGVHCRYAGTATQLGYLIGRTVYEAMITAGKAYTERPY